MRVRLGDGRCNFVQMYARERYKERLGAAAASACVGFDLRTDYYSVPERGAFYRGIIFGGEYTGTGNGCRSGFFCYGIIFALLSGDSRSRNGKGDGT